MRLIDADIIKIPSTSVDAFENCRNCKLLDEYQVKEIIDDAPTVDAEPIRHGEWLNDGVMDKCSLCGLSFLKVHINGNPTFKYCPNCGAKMDRYNTCKYCKHFGFCLDNDCNFNNCEGFSKFERRDDD